MSYQTPGVYREDIFPPPPPIFRTGVPVFLGLAASGPLSEVRQITLWPQFVAHYGLPQPDALLAYAVRGFFENGGRLCYVLRLADRTPATLDTALRRIEPLNDCDLLCAPDVVRPPPAADPFTIEAERAEQAGMQTMLLDHCNRLGDRFAILDGRTGVDLAALRAQRRALGGANGALYYPWLRPADAPPGSGLVPPCGHVAGIYARSDAAVGVHKAPANERIDGVVDLEVAVSAAEQGILNPEGINCLRSFPGRGIRIWGARTLSNESAWAYVNVRRIFLTAGRWVQRNMADIPFEPNDNRLWVRISRELTAYFNELFRRGALKGASAEEAFYIKCNDETNPPAARERGEVITEIGLAPALPNEFIVVRIIHGTGGVAIAGPTVG